MPDLATHFWDDRNGEEPLLRLIRTVVACSMGFKPPKPFGVCGCCPAQRACHAVSKGRIAAAQHRAAQAVSP